MSNRSILLLLLALPGLADDCRAQQATSANYALLDSALSNAGGGTCSPDHAAYTNLGALSSDLLGSPSFQGTIGFLATSDPQPTNQPVLFGITPNFGPTAGGTSITIAGLNFDKFGVGPSTFVSIGGTPVSLLTVVSNTEIQAVTPPGLVGPRLVALANSNGATLDPDGFIYSPAIVTSPIAQIGGSLLITNYGTIGGMYRTFVSTSTWTLSTPYGTLLVGPFPFVELIPLTPYPLANGVDAIALPIPSMPALQGLVVHFQSLSISSLNPFQAKFTNASSTAIQ